MKRLFIISFLLLPLLSFAQEWSQDTSNLNGHVKSVYYVQMDYITNIPENWSYFSTKTEFNSRGEWIYHSNFLECEAFNTKIRVYDPANGRHIYDHSLYEGDTTDTWQMMYNKKGQPIKEIHLQDSKIDSSYFVYNKNNLLIGKYHYQNKKSTQYFYNSKKKLIRIESITVNEKTGDSLKSFKLYDKHSRIIKDSTFSQNYIISKSWEYDKEGRLILANSLLYKASKTMVVDYRQTETPSISYVSVNSRDDRNSRIEYEYNQKGQLVRMTNYFIDGEIRRDYHYEYNENNLVSREIFRGSEEHHHADTKFEYIYDSHGNWILRYSYDVENSEYYSVEFRKIEYY